MTLHKGYVISHKGYVIGYGANLWDATRASGGGKPRIQMAQSRVEQLKEIILAQDDE
jgi:hypothetical protein